MGILIDTENEEDKKVYEDATKDIDSIIHNSEDFSYVKAPQKRAQSEPKSKAERTVNTKTNFTKSSLKTTKDLSQETELSSRKINSILVDKKLMYKKDDDWFITKKGKEFGGIEKDGQYGQFIIWPEEIKNEL